jgi:hypothetical protein
MKALIMMLFNSKDQTYHPILYFEHPFPGGNPEDLFRFRSKVHRTIGFNIRQDALDSIETELVQKLVGYKIYKDLNEDLIWDGDDIPADNQLRGINQLRVLESV